MIIAVFSPPGAGKTHWISQQIAQTNKPVGYFSPQTDSLPIDAIYLQSEYPQLKLYWTGEEAQLNKTITYLEIPWYLDLAGIEPLLQTFNSHRVAIIPEDTDSTQLKTWADEIIPGDGLTKPTTALQIHRGVLTGEILDFDSLATFWLELTQGAYGEVIRAKGIFDLVDGQIYYGDFRSGELELKFKPLNLPRWLNGKPNRKSGFEIVGSNLDKTEIAQTVRDCCVPESAINYYQQQVKETLATEPEVEVV
ncbi:MAG: GTP-binding protein [Symploca sp. SIO3C6]|uniref:GTP-binding protein n=1 Tax=Symploca sp. SIO1C4 TaxID=2607765 RepID=A0A6B3N9S0_9CYAN|nr:GTP-binding protein [Symploca sp. SIO3C6]NER26361.1 GTP-binding protein [Symploca sp. SIO1C4]NET05543.1 GTP-binding protein [Symploca sp. SIO2B6]